MSSNDNYWIPRTLDDPPLFFIFEADVAIVFMFFTFMGALLSMFLVGFGIAIFCTRAYARMKEEGGQGLMLKVLYWYTPSDLWLSKKVPSHIREYVG